MDNVLESLSIYRHVIAKKPTKARKTFIFALNL
jgi:hypothetical protein